MTKRNISIGILVLMIITNAYLVYRIHSNTMTIASYDAGISQRTGIGRMESYWTKYIGASKNSSLSYEERIAAEDDSNYSIIALVILDIILIGALIKLNKKPKTVVAPLSRQEEWERELRSHRRR